LADVGWNAHKRVKNPTVAVTFNQVERPQPGGGFDVDVAALSGRIADEIALEGVRGQTAEAVAGNFGRAAVRVTEPHPHAIGQDGVKDEAIRANSRVPMAQGARQRFGVPTTRIGLWHEQEIIAVRMAFYDVQTGHVSVRRKPADASLKVE
jgi:hypothetical protein